MIIGWAFPRILQAIWEADPSKVPVQVSKINGMDGYRRGTLWPSQLYALVYSILLAPDNDCIIICINLVLLMG